VAISGRAARFSSGGEVPILIPQSLGTSSIEFKEFGTIVDFVPIVLGNGKIHLEVYPEVSTLDPALGIELDSIRVPGFRQRRAHTAVEMQAGQTFILAGLVEERTDAQGKGLPWVADIPGIGVPFRKTTSQVDEIETLIMVTPEFVDPLEPGQVPCQGPGMFTTTPTACQLHCAGHVEVPTYYNPTSGLMSCGTDPCGPCGQCGGPNGCYGQSCGGGQCCNAGPMITDGVSMPGGVGYDDAGSTVSEEVLPEDSRMAPTRAPMPTVPDDLSLPAESTPTEPAPREAAPNSGASHYSPPRQPVYMRNGSKPHNPQPIADGAPASGQSGLIGPVGYDVQ
jgi:pilus assembly protein CpaC